MMQDGCKVYVDSYMASNGSCFMVTWTIFKNHVLEVGLTQTTGRPWHSEHSQPLIYSILSSVRTNGQDCSLHVRFILKGSQILAFQLKGYFKSKTSIQEYRNEIQNSC